MGELQIMVGGRRSGRTTACIKWAAENDAYIVCANQREARRIADCAREMGLNIKFPVTFDEMPMRGAWPTKIAIDNADWLLRLWLGGQHELSFATFEGVVAAAPREEG